MADKDEYREVLEEFVNDIENTGGVHYEPDGTCAPAANEGWSDLGLTYLHACQVLGRKPVISMPDCPECEMDMVLDGDTVVCPGCGYYPGRLDDEGEHETA